MRFDILGPAGIRLDGERMVAVGGPGMRALPVLLLLDAERIAAPAMASLLSLRGVPEVVPESHR
jgi:hypothetical protein